MNILCYGKFSNIYKSREKRKTRKLWGHRRERKPLWSLVEASRQMRAQTPAQLTAFAGKG